MLRWAPEGPGGQQRGADGGVEAPAWAQRGAWGAGHGAQLIVPLLILPDGRQLLHQPAVALPVRLRVRGKQVCFYYFVDVITYCSQQEAGKVSGS